MHNSKDDAAGAGRPAAAATPINYCYLRTAFGSYRKHQATCLRYFANSGPLARRYVAAACCVVPEVTSPESQSFGVIDRPKI
jgi:hypothetical protein